MNGVFDFRTVSDRLRSVGSFFEVSIRSIHAAGLQMISYLFGIIPTTPLLQQRELHAIKTPKHHAPATVFLHGYCTPRAAACARIVNKLQRSTGPWRVSFGLQYSLFVCKKLLSSHSSHYSINIPEIALSSRDLDVSIYPTY